ncbi:MAG: lipocalin family protein [Bacteroidia bacterium]
MKLILKTPLLALLLYSCNCADDNRTDYDPAAISGSWKLAQRISGGEITIYNDNQYKHLRFNTDSTYTSHETFAGEVHIRTGFYTLQDGELMMISNDSDTIRATIAHLNSNTLALQFEHDHDNDGVTDSVRESYVSQL